jgi:hypothetical protein
MKLVWRFGPPRKTGRAAAFFPLLARAGAAGLVAGVLIFAGTGPAVGRAGKSAETTSDHLRPGQFVWQPELAPTGTMTMTIDLAHQRAYVYRDGVRIGAATISSGKRGYETPTGVFTILQKDKDHYSKKYHHAPMPYDLRLTWEGVSVHGGHLPGYPASHGCVRLPIAFSRALFNEVSLGMAVTITDRESGANDGLMATGSPLRPQLAENEHTGLLSPEILSAGGYPSGPPPAPATSSSTP